MVYEYECLVIEGGGIKGIAFAGAIKKLDELNILKGITKFIGSSSGAITAGALACRFTTDDINEILINTDFNSFKDDSFCIILDIYRIVEHYGIYKGDMFYNWYGKILEEKTGNKDITFMDVYKRYGTEITITGTCLNKRCTYYYNYKSHPDMSLRLAVRISMSIPLFFRAIELQGDILVDGGVLNNYPIWYYDKDYDSNIVDIDKKVLGLNLMSENNLPDDQIYHGDNKIDNMINYITSLVDSMLTQLERLHVKQGYWKRTIPICTFDIKATDFDISNENKEKLIKSGYDCTTHFFSNLT